MSFGQNRINFRHKLNQSNIDSAKFTLRTYDTSSSSKKYKDIILIAEGSTLKCLIKLNSKGEILVDFWQITSDEHKGDSRYVNVDTPLNIDNPISLVDGRDKVGLPTRVLTVPFSALGFGIATIPVRIRGRQQISSTIDSEPTVTSPRPDIAVTAGYTFGRSIITNRAITNLSATVGPFVGISGVEIKDGVVKAGTPLFGTKISQTNVALTYGLSMTLARNNLGLVLAYGFDKSLGKYSDDWIYQGKNWFGIGVSAGLGLF